MLYPQSTISQYQKLRELCNGSRDTMLEDSSILFVKFILHVKFTGLAPVGKVYVSSHSQIVDYKFRYRRLSAFESNLLQRSTDSRPPTHLQKQVFVLERTLRTSPSADDGRFGMMASPGS
jgi:hypothetical protein